MHSIELRMLRTGAMFEFDSKIYEKGPVDVLYDFSFCTDIKTKKVERIHLDTLVQIAA